MISNCQGTIYSATNFLEKCRNVVLEKWFFKLGFFFWSTTFLEPEKMLIYSIKPSFFLVNQFSRTRFFQPDFSNQISMNCKNQGCRIKGWVVRPGCEHFSTLQEEENIKSADKNGGKMRYIVFNITVVISWKIFKKKPWRNKI